MRIITAIIISIFTLSTHSQTVDNFELKNIEGKYISYNTIKGKKLTVIDFWASWCKPCMKAIPELNSVYNNFKDKEVQVIGVNCDGPRSAAKVEPLVNTLGIKYPVLTDMDKTVMTSLNLSAFPTLILINSANKIVWIHEGFSPGDEKLIHSKIEQELSN